MRARIVARLVGSVPPSDVVRQALAGWPDELTQRLFDRPLTPAAVLVPLVERSEGVQVLLTRRTEHLRDHPGQVSFPGGRMEPADRDPLATALREAEEEIGVAPGFVEPVGYLPPQPVITGFAVSPVVAFLRAGFTLQPDTFEVAEIFEVPLEFFLDPGNLIASQRAVRGVTVPVFEYLYPPHRIWGATAQMLKKFSEIIYET